MNYTLELNEKQAEVLKVVLEEFFRIRMNQFGGLAESLAFAGFDHENAPDEEFHNRLERRGSAEEVFRAGLKVAQPEWQSYTPVPQQEDSLIAQDIWQVVRHRLYLDRGGDPNGMSVDAREPLRLSQEPLPKMILKGECK